MIGVHKTRNKERNNFKNVEVRAIIGPIMALGQGY